LRGVFGVLLTPQNRQAEADRFTRFEIHEFAERPLIAAAGRRYQLTPIGHHI
jgi:hypothetical protein